MILSILSALFLILLGIVWTRAGYMDREQAQGITNIWFYTMLPAMLLQQSQLTWDSADAFRRHALLWLGLSILITISAGLLNRIDLPRAGRLMNDRFRILTALALLLIGTAGSFLLQRYSILLPTILGSALSMLYNTVLPVSMFLVGNVLAYVLGFQKERPV